MTTNESFIVVSEKLKSMHIKNHDFFLKTLDPEVESIDPFSDELTEDQINKLDTECEQNIWFFLREIVRYNTGEDLVQFELDLSKLASTYCAINNINQYVVTHVGLEKYHCMCAIILWEILFKKDYNKIALNNIYNFGSHVYGILINMIKELPPYLSERLIKTNEDEPEAIGIVTEDGSEIRLFAPQYPVAKRNIDNIISENAGNLSIYPDFEYMPVNIELLDTDIHDNIEYTMVVTDVGSDKDINYNNINRFISHSVKWDPMFYDVDINYIKEYIINKSVTHYMYIEHSYIELGHDDEWATEVINRYKFDDNTAKRLIFLKR